MLITSVFWCANAPSHLRNSCHILEFGQIAAGCGRREAALSTYDRGLAELAPNNAAGRVGHQTPVDAMC